MIVTDIVSYSDILFGLLTLAGFAYAPKLAGLLDQEMWRIDYSASPAGRGGQRRASPGASRLVSSEIASGEGLK